MVKFLKSIIFALVFSLGFLLAPQVQAADCKNIPVIYYHHIQPYKDAKAKKQLSLTVDNATFEKQMSYLSSKGYHTLTPDEFYSGLTGGGLPLKSILVTFDDGYADFYSYAYPVLQKYSLHGAMFLPTGLVGNPDYLNWGQVDEIKGSGLINFLNHTWSHVNLTKSDDAKVRFEIQTAKTQLADHGLGPLDFFAYPYGAPGKFSIQALKDSGIKLAFTTIPGKSQCASDPYHLRRIRIGNSSLSSYGI